MIDNCDDRYTLTEHGVAIRETYTTTLMSAEEAIRLADWLIWHYVKLDKIYRKMLEEQKQKGEQKV